MSGTTIRGPIPAHVLSKMSAQDRAPLGRAGRTLEEIQDRNTIKAERDLQKQIAQFLRVRGYEFNVSRMDRRKTDRSGWPDYVLGVRPKNRRWAIAVGLEVKLPSGKLSPGQESVLAALAANGWLTKVVRSVEEVKTLLDGLEEGNPNEATTG